jgi:acetyl esterase/lipase
MKLGILVAATVCMLAAGGASQSALAEGIVADVAAVPVLEDRYPRITTAFAADVISHPDLIYSTQPGHRPLRLDLYRPKSSASPRPLVIYVHGGGWQSGHTRHSGAFANWPEVLASLARRGYVVASVEYRLSGEAPFPAAIHDVKNSIQWLRSRAADFAIDPKQVFIWGGSAGGQLAALAAMSCGEQSLTPPASVGETTAATQSACVQGLVAWYGVFDFTTNPGLTGAGAPSTVSKYLGCVPPKCATAAALASPITHLDAKDPPALMIHGEIDRVVAVGQSRAFHAAAQGKGVAAELVVIPNVDHSFIGNSPEATRKASLLALTKTFDFIDTLSGAQRE